VQAGRKRGATLTLGRQPNARNQLAENLVQRRERRILAQHDAAAHGRGVDVVQAHTSEPSHAIVECEGEGNVAVPHPLDMSAVLLHVLGDAGELEGRRGGLWPQSERVSHDGRVDDLCNEPEEGVVVLA
jgi:hypothetical protein